MTETADVVVVGGGAMGVSIAYHLAAAGAGRIVLLERDAALGTGSTGRCAGGFRHQFSSEINVRLSLASVRMIRRVHGGARPAARRRRRRVPLPRPGRGVVGRVPGGRSDAAIPRRPGGGAGRAGGGGAHPGLASTEDLIGATFGPDDGIADPSGLTNGYATLARRAGAVIRLGTEATTIRTSSGRQPRDRGLDARRRHRCPGRRQRRRRLGDRHSLRPVESSCRSTRSPAMS